MFDKICVCAVFVLSITAICRAERPGQSPCAATLEHAKAFVTALASKDGRGQLAHANAVSDLAAGFWPDPRCVILIASARRYSDCVPHFVEELPKVVNNHRGDLLSTYLSGNGDIAICAGALIAAYRGTDSDKEREVFVKSLGAHENDLKRRLVAYAGLMSNPRGETPVVGLILRTVSQLPVKERGRIWFALAEGNLLASRASAGDDPIRQDLSGIDDCSLTDLAPWVKVIGKAAVAESTIICEIGRAYSDAPEILRAAMGDYPPDVRVFAIRMCGHRRIANVIHGEHCVIRRLLSDRSIAVRCAAAQTLAVLQESFEMNKERLKLAQLILGDSSNERELQQGARLLEDASSETEAFTFMDDQPESRMPAAFFRADPDWVEELRYALTHANAGQRRLAVARAVDKVFSERRSKAFREAIMKVLRQQQIDEVDRHVLADLESAIQVIQPFTDVAGFKCGEQRTR